MPSRPVTEGDQRAWEDYLPHALFAMRMSICVSTGVAPFAAMFGRNASASLEMVFGAPPTLPEDAADMYEYTTHPRSRMAKAQTHLPAYPACVAVDAQTQAGPVQEVRTVLDRTVADQT
jgi:hypothetical protein